MQYAYEEINRLKNAEKKNETITLDHGDWLWDNETDSFADSDIKTTQDEPVRMEWRTVLQADWVKYAAIFAGLMLVAAAFAAEGAVSIGGLWWLLFLIPFVTRRGRNMQGNGKLLLLFLLINLFTGSTLGLWFFVIPFLFWHRGGEQHRKNHIF